tara:strand:- start:2715 stop:4499 length:1785 start_codon:yes stop_codon:yes gene_type:complete
MIHSRVFELLDQSEKKRAVLILFLNLISSLLDLFGIASILPFISVLSNPEIIKSNEILSYLYNYSNVDDLNSFLIFLGIITLILISISNIFKIFLNYFQLKFVFEREYSVSNKLMSKFLKSNYEWFLDKNSSDLGKKILSEVNEIINSSLLPLLHLTSSTIVVFVIIVFVFFINPMIAIFTFLSFGSVYYIFFTVIKKKIKNFGKGRHSNNKKRFKIIIEAFKNIKEIKLRNLEDLYSLLYERPSKEYAKFKALTNVYAIIPKFFIEIIAFGGILILVIFSLSNNLSLDNVIPLLAIYAFAGYRVLPAMQLVYTSMTNMNYSIPALIEITNDLKKEGGEVEKKNLKKINFSNQILVEDLYYKYPKSKNFVLKKINFSLDIGKSLGIVGESGSGKTTLINILCGLLIKSKGKMIVDSTELKFEHLDSWQSQIGYVSQNISILDSNIYENIAFGVSKNNINKNLVKKVCGVVNLKSHIENNLTNKYETILGEDGIVLSGGQRQRLIIARALYFKPKILILDEATSSLDPKVEKIIINKINKIEEITLIQVSHRYATLLNCDKVLFLNRGSIEEISTLSMLSKHNIQFKKLFGINND